MAVNLTPITLHLNLVQGLNSIWKTGFDERFSFDFLGNAWNRLGYFFPVYNAKDKVATIIQVYWGTTGKLESLRKLEDWSSEVGISVGLPINLDASLNK
jgi:hypothetical protein